MMLIVKSFINLENIKELFLIELKMMRYFVTIFALY
jgi:hypothetical protein